MKVRWGSTLAMLNRVETKRDVSCHPLSFSFAFTHRSLQFVDKFILELRRRETNTEKCQKLADLALTEEELDWGSDYFVIFSKYSKSILYLSSGRCSPLTLACRCCSAGIFSGNVTDTSRFLRSKNCMAPGRRYQRSCATVFSGLHFKQP